MTPLEDGLYWLQTAPADWRPMLITRGSAYVLMPHMVPVTVTTQSVIGPLKRPESTWQAR